MNSTGRAGGLLGGGFAESGDKPAPWRCGEAPGSGASQPGRTGEISADAAERPFSPVGIQSGVRRDVASAGPERFARAIVISSAPVARRRIRQWRRCMRATANLRRQQASLPENRRLTRRGFAAAVLRIYQCELGTDIPLRLGGAASKKRRRRNPGAAENAEKNGQAGGSDRRGLQ